MADDFPIAHPPINVKALSIAQNTATPSKNKTTGLSFEGNIYHCCCCCLEWYGDGAGNTIEEKSSIFCLI